MRSAVKQAVITSCRSICGCRGAKTTKNQRTLSVSVNHLEGRRTAAVAYIGFFSNHNQHDQLLKRLRTAAVLQSTLMRSLLVLDGDEGEQQPVQGQNGLLGTLQLPAGVQ
jgi:hypothetical protein